MEVRGSSWAAASSSSSSSAVHGLAGSLGSELRRLSGLVGAGAVAGLVAQVVRLLELLEALERPEDAARPPPRTPPAAPTATTAPGTPAPPEAPLTPGGAEPAAPSSSSSSSSSAPSSDREHRPRQEAQALEQRLLEAQRSERRLQGLLAQAREENQWLLAQLAGSQAQADHAGRKEREVMLQLKEVVDKQRHEIRAQGHEIARKARDAEALQEQLSRFMAVNEELRRKLAVVQAQLKSALERKEAAEEALREARREAAWPSTPRDTPEAGTQVEAGSSESPPGGSPDGGSIPREELRQILTERSELKTSLFLVQEELAYYQRELLNDERIPGILLEAVRSTIRKQRKKIRAKMLGTAEEPVSSEDEEEGVWLAAPLGSPDYPDGHLPESRIKSFFSPWYRRSSPADSSPAGAWEIVDPQDVGSEEEAEEGAPPSSSGPPKGTLPCP